MNTQRSILVMFFLVLSISVGVEETKAQCIGCSSGFGFCETYETFTGSSSCGCNHTGCKCEGECGFDSTVIINADTILDIQDILNGSISLINGSVVAVEGLKPDSYNPFNDDEFKSSINLSNLFLMRELGLYYSRENKFYYYKSNNREIKLFKKIMNNCINENISLKTIYTLNKVGKL